MKKLSLLLILTVMTLVSCDSCLNKFYGVHEPLTLYRLELQIEKDADRLIVRKIDSVNRANTRSCGYTSVELTDKDRVLCFTNPECECYYLGLDSRKVTVYAVTIAEKKDAGWLFYREQLDTSEHRVTERIRKFVQLVKD